MDNVSDRDHIIAKISEKVESLICEFREIASQSTVLENSDTLNNYEENLYTKAHYLADHITALQIQRSIANDELKEEANKLVKEQPGKIKNMGNRTVKIRLRGGTQIELGADYYHKKSTIKKHRGQTGFYPCLALLGIHDRCTPALAGLASLLATAACSFDEATNLIKALLGFKINVKTIRLICKRFSLRVRACLEADKLDFSENISGRFIAVSTDGGRIRIRKNKRGKKTAKKRTRYKTDWREPKLLIIYVVGKDGKRDSTIAPIMDASLGGPDHLFGLLVYYLKKLKIILADKILFVSDGAKWIWDRVKKLTAKIGLQASQCLFALDFYHAVEHLNDMANQKRWGKALRSKWVNKQKRHLLKGQLQQFMDKIEMICKGSKNKKLKRDRAYFRTHLPHMHYKALKDMGLPIGSGAVESGIRRVINLRLKGPGIFWHEDTADALLLMRSYYKAGRWKMLQSMAYLGGIVMI